MGLEDFERKLAAEKSRESTQKLSRGEEKNGRERHHHHRHRSHRNEDSERRERHDHRHRHRHHHKRHHEEDEDDDNRKERKRHRTFPKQNQQDQPKRQEQDEVKVFSNPSSPNSNDNDDDEAEWIEKEALTAPPEEDLLDRREENQKEEKIQRDAWMQEPSGLEIEYVHRDGNARAKTKEAKSQFVSARGESGFGVEGSRENHAEDLRRDFDSDGDEVDGDAERDVDYLFGDSGSSWRMTRLRAVYRQAEESGRSVDEVAQERYGSLRDFDDAREEERELGRREMYGNSYRGLEKPSGELFQERKEDEERLVAGTGPQEGEKEAVETINQGERMPEQDTARLPVKTTALDSTALNKLKAQLMRAKLRNADNAAQLEEEYNAALGQASMANSMEPEVVVLNTPHLAGSRSGEVTAVSGKRARERGTLVENEDMSINDMIRAERREKNSHAGSEVMKFAERIAKDARFTDDLDYLDENAEKLSKRSVASDAKARAMGIDDFKRNDRILKQCPLCFHEDSISTGGDPSTDPIAPVVSLATRTYLTLPTVPDISLPSKPSKSTSKPHPGGAVIVPITHHPNLLAADDDEWEEIRNFMKSLTRFYASLNLGVLFYENATHPSSHQHAALHAIPLPHHLLATAPAYFREAILEREGEAEWSQHRPIIDTLALSRPGAAKNGDGRPGLGKWAFRKSMVTHLPYFHVFFELDGGMGHVVEEEGRWPRGDAFARGVVGSMLGREPETVRKQGRWEKGGERKRVEIFRAGWEGWDWTKVLREEGPR